MMYHAIIVDDEKIVRLALRNMIEFEPFGIELIGEAKDGLEALNLIKEHDVDIIITDLKMPNLDGIELIKTLKQSEFKGRILVLSNYDDFELVKEALKSGASDYILKGTMKVSDMKSAIQKLIQSLDEDKLRDEKIMGDTIEIKRGKRLYRDKLLKSICISPYDFEYLSQLISEHQFHIDLYDNYYFFITLDRLSAAIKDKKIVDLNSLGFNIKSIALDALNNKSNGEIIDLRKDEYVLIVPKALIELPVNVSEKIISRLNMYTNQDASVVMSEGPIDKLYELVLMSKKYALYNFYTGTNKSYYLNAFKPLYEMNVDYEKLFTNIKFWLYNNQWDKIENVFNEVICEGEINCIYPRVIKSICVVLLDFIINVQKLPNKDGFKNTIQSLRDITFKEDYIEAIFNLLRAIEIQFNHEPESDIIERVEYYIKKHIEKKITLKAVADYVHLNPSYLSRLFKQEKGINLIEFTNQLKIEKAKYLLKIESNSVEQVGYAIGIKDPYYFNKVFKKNVGMSPTAYRNKSHK